METRITYLCVQRRAWGRGVTLAKAQRECAAAGGSGKRRLFRVIDDGSSSLPFVDLFGQSYTAPGAVVEEWIRGEWASIPSGEDYCAERDPETTEPKEGA